MLRELLRREPVEKSAVEFFGQVVALLVSAVDAPFNVGYLRVGGAGSTGLVLNMPEVEIGAVLAGDKGEPRVGQGLVQILGEVPVLCRTVMKASDCGG